MRKIYIIASLLAFSVGVFAQSNLMPKNTLQKSDYASGITANRFPPRPLVIPAEREPLIAEDFENVVYPALPDGWSTSEVTVNTGGTTPAFITGDAFDANNGGFFPVPIIDGNHFVYANDDGPPCDCDMSSVFLELPPLDLSTLTNPSIAFDFYFPGDFGAGDFWIEVSDDDGATFTEIIRLDADFNNKDEWQSIIVPLFDYSAATAIIRLFWSDGSSWADGFAIDNIVVDAMAEVDVATAAVKYGNWDADVLYGAGHFSVIPLSQAHGTPMTGIMANFGVQDVTGAVFNYSIVRDDVVQSTGTMAPLDIPFVSRDTTSFVDTYVPDGLGTYDIVLDAVVDGDGKPDNNVRSLSYEVSNNLYGRDSGWRQAILNNFTGGAVLFDIYNNDVMTFIQVAVDGDIPDGESRFIFGNVYEVETFDNGIPSSFLLLGSSVEAEVFQEDMSGVGESKWIVMEMEEPLDLEAGKTYAVELQLDNDLLLTVSGNTIPFLGAYLLSNGDDLEFTDLDAAATATAIMVRMGVEDAVGIEELKNDVAVLNQNIPNPARDFTRIDFELLSAQNVKIIVTDILGKVVINDNLGTLPQGAQQYTLDVNSLNAGVYQYSIVTENGRLTKSMTVVK